MELQKIYNEDCLKIMPAMPSDFADLRNYNLAK